MDRLNPIRIGDTLIRTYKFYNPKAENLWDDPDVPEADLTSPLNLTGTTVTWNLRNNGTLLTYAEGAGVTVTDATGIVRVEIETAVTATWVRDRANNSYVKIVDAGGNVVSEVQQREVVVRQDED